MGVRSARKKFDQKAPEWWKHLRPFNKRRFWKQTRQKKDDE